MTRGPLLLRSEAAERLNVSESTVVRLGRAGAITEIRVGKRASPQEGWSVLKGVLANLAVGQLRSPGQGDPARPEEDPVPRLPVRNRVTSPKRA
jgi:hypothetical protein